MTSTVTSSTTPPTVGGVGGQGSLRRIRHLAAPLDGDPRALRRIFSRIPTPITFVAAIVDGEPVGFVIGSFATISLDPTLVAIYIQDSSRTWPLLRGASHLGISILGTDHRDIVRTLAAKDGDRFAAVDWIRTERDAVLIDGAAAHLEVTLASETVQGDHIVALLNLHAAGATKETDPLIFVDSTPTSLR